MRRAKWRSQGRLLKVDDVALLVNYNSPREKWDLAKIIECFRDKTESYGMRRSRPRMVIISNQFANVVSSLEVMIFEHIIHPLLGGFVENLIYSIFRVDNIFLSVFPAKRALSCRNEQFSPCFAARLFWIVVSFSQPIHYPSRRMIFYFQTIFM